MPADRFIEALNEQIGSEFGSSHQYLAAAIWYDNQTLPRLAKIFYHQALEERQHGLMMARYLLDWGLRPRVPGIREPRQEFADFVEPITKALEQERRVTDQISKLAMIAREENDYVSEQFMHWFLKEQVEEIDLFLSLQEVAERSRDRVMDVEEYIARENVGSHGDDPTAPGAAGGALG